jgi:hypothetical protein
LSISSSSSTSKVGQTVTFTGSVSPDKVGHLIYLQRLGADRDWHTVKIGVVGAGSTYRFTWTFGAPGTKVFRTKVPGGPFNVGAVSAPVTISVAAAPVASLPPAS